MTQSDEKEKDVREIINYRRALRAAIGELDRKSLGSNLIKKLHHILLNSVRGAHKGRGNFRKSQVYIGFPGDRLDDIIYLPLLPSHVPSFLLIGKSM